MRRLAGDRLLVATHNSGKLEEIADLLSGHAIQVIGAASLGLHEPEETGTDFIANARIKAHAASRATGLPALADDSGLEINALDGAPGVHTADWAETPGGRDFVLAMTRASQRTCRFRCRTALDRPVLLHLRACLARWAQRDIRRAREGPDHVAHAWRQRPWI